MIQREIGMDLDAEVRCGLADEAERSSDMNLHDDVERLVRHRVDHFVESEASWCSFSLFLV